LKTITKIIQIELFNPEQEIIQGNVYANIKTDDQLIHSILSPISGKIIDQNKSILSDYNLLEKDPYFKGWLYTIVPSDLEYELNHLTPCSSDRF
jgi:glycine cleavage system H lipoate-binding protein